MTTATQQAPTYDQRDGDRIEANLEPSRRGNGGRSGPSPLRDPHQVARGLGWFSIGLGLAECAAPRSVARMIGLRDDDTNRNTLFAYGVREIASGIGILMGDRPVVPVWARVGGDVMDLAFLGRALRSARSEKNRVAAAIAAVLGVTLLDVMTGRSLGAESTAARGASRPGIEVREQITIGKPPEELYRFWRDFQNLPRFMEHLESVRVLDDRRSRWTARAPAGKTVEWEAEITEDGRTSGSRGARSARPTCPISARPLPAARPAAAGPKCRSSFATTRPAASSAPWSPSSSARSPVCRSRATCAASSR